MQSTKQAPPAAALYYMIVLTLLAVMAIVVQALSMGPLRDSFWGFHLYAFLPIPAAIVGWAILVIACVAMWRPMIGGQLFGLLQIADRRRLLTVLILAAVSTLLFWLFRSDQILLGDGLPLTTDLPKGQSFHPRQPGTMWLQQFLYQHVGPMFRGEGVADGTVARNTVALGSIAAGFLFVFVAFGLGRTLVRGTKTQTGVPWLATLVLITQGYALLYFGYIENYTFYALLVAIYLLAALRHLQSGLTIQVAVVAFLVSLCLHLSTIALLPSLVFLMGRGLVQRKTRTDALTGIGLFVAGLFLADWAIHAMSSDFGLWTAVNKLIGVSRTSQGGGAGLSYWFTSVHLRDFLNEHFLIGPLAAMLLVPAAIYALYRRAWITAPAVFLLLASLSYLAGSFTTSEPALGYARDWDLFAPAGVCYTATGLFFLIRQVGSHKRILQLLGFAVVFSLVTLAPWVQINHSESLTLERFKTLPLGYGRAQVVVANYYLRRQQYDESMRWLQKALQAFPNNANTYNLMASIFIEREQYEQAREAYIRAVALRHDKLEFRHNFAFLLLHMKREEEALVQLRWLVAKAPETTRYWELLKQVLTNLGRDDELPAVNEKLLSHYDSILATKPDDMDLLQRSGIILSDLGRHDEAIARFKHALDIDSTSAAALFNLASALGRTGREEAARPYLERFVQLYPNHELAGWARERLAELSQ